MKKFSELTHLIKESYYEDLSDYKYNLRFADCDIKSIGWLDINHEFTKGDVDINIINKLKNIEPFVQHKGWHTCEFCNEGTSSNELWICGDNGQIYAMPRMIIHYIEQHKYLPPKEFLDSIKNNCYTKGDKIFDSSLNKIVNKIRLNLK